MSKVDHNLTLKAMEKVSWVSSSGQSNEPKRPVKYTSTEVKKRGAYNPSALFSRLTDHLFDEDNIPELITASYQDDYDILHIHDIVLCRLSREAKDLPQLIYKKNEIELRLKERLKVIERKKLQLQLGEITGQINTIVGEEKKSKYLDESKELLTRYQQLGPVIRLKSFLCNTDETLDQENVDPNQEERLRIIRKYLEIAKKYIPINVVRIVPNDPRCPECGNELVPMDPEDYSVEVCEECGYERINLSKPSTFKDQTCQTKNTSNSDYEDRENFLKALECYLGEQQPPGDALFRALDEWASSYGHPDKETIRQTPLNDDTNDGTRGEYGKAMLYQALADTGYADNYKDVKLIGHLHWGWELPTMTQQERDIIVQDYDDTQKVYNRIKKDRKSSLNAQLRLYRHLEARNHKFRGKKVKPTEFKIPATPSIIEEHDMYWREMVKVIPDAKFTSLK